MNPLKQSIMMTALFFVGACEVGNFDDADASNVESRIEALKVSSDADAGNFELKIPPSTPKDISLAARRSENNPADDKVAHDSAVKDNLVATTTIRHAGQAEGIVQDKLSAIQFDTGPQGELTSRSGGDPWWEEYETTNDIFYDTGNVSIGTEVEATSRLQVSGAESGKSSSSAMPTGVLRLESTNDQYLFLDGNEIDSYSKTSPWGATTLYFNHNSKSNITMVKNGGLVGVGTDPSSNMKLTVKGETLDSTAGKGSFQVTDSGGSKLAMDGNEVNSSGGLYLNHRSDKFIMMCASGCNVGVGAFNADTLQKFSERLIVDGAVRAEEVLVDNVETGADFVFEDDYDLMSLDEVSSFVEENHHLPGIAPADEMKNNGLAMGEFQIQLLQKVEELTLYAVEQNNRMRNNERRLNSIEAENRILREELARIGKGGER